MSLLAWRSGLKRDRAALMAFECTEKPRPRTTTEHSLQLRHDAWWEFEVQSAIRCFRPPLSGAGTSRLLLGWRENELVAVSHYTETDGLEVVALDYMAVSLKGRHRGGGYADEMCAVTFDEITSAAIATTVSETLISSHIYERNESSQKMARRMGMHHDDFADDGVQVWQRTLVHNL